ncbi:hypothetical protein ISN44_As10g010590 [Arabidopsis suecica]|uniref:DUF4218 domain-containing protein n=1 Tax=Arabidopsis suecica TaxID=45249 RepID=A0A8T1ZXD5_ARASU|nr:hypothetical protein ISN44_As10g010590 [Arabidopsis suecica]
MDEGKFTGMKSHDCHVVMQRLLPFAFEHLLAPNVHQAIAGVSAFFRDLYSRTLTVDGIRNLEENIPMIICNLEKIFSPSFFDVMEHLPIHLPFERNYGAYAECSSSRSTRVPENLVLPGETNKSKRRIFGLRNLSQISSSSRSSGFTYSPHIDFHQAMEKRNERIATLKKEMEEQKAALEEQKAENMRLDAEHKKRDEEMATFMNEMRVKLP